jgi:hypothetical protein
MRRGHDRPTGQPSGTANTGTGDPRTTGASSAGEYQQSGEYVQQGSGATGQGYPSQTVDYDRGTGQGYPSQSGQYATGEGRRAGARPYGEEEYERAGARGAAEPRRNLGLAAWLMILSGLVTFFAGITGIISGLFFPHLVNYPFYYSTRSRGVTELIIGAVAFMIGVCLLLGMHWARHVAIVVAVLAAIFNFMFLPYYPIWSIILVGLYIFVIWECARDNPRRREFA